MMKQLSLMIKVIVINQFRSLLALVYTFFSTRKEVIVTPFYEAYLTKEILSSIKSEEIAQGLNGKTKLPNDYGSKLSERIVEIPWFFHNFSSHSGIHMDLGASLNFSPYLKLLNNKTQSIIISNLNSERDCHWTEEISYIYTDSRKKLFADDVLDSVSCISVLEHVGLDNSRYTSNSQYNEAKNEDYLQLINEIYRMLKTGGNLYLTIPYGTYKNHGWLQVFDAKMVSKIIEAFNPVSKSITFYSYDIHGWQLSDQRSCDLAQYTSTYEDPLYQVGAGAVVCLKLQK